MVLDKEAGDIWLLLKWIIEKWWQEPGINNSDLMMILI
jgi:hypothetical protein